MELFSICGIVHCHWRKAAGNLWSQYSREQCSRCFLRYLLLWRTKNIVLFCQKGHSFHVLFDIQVRQPMLTLVCSRLCCRWNSVLENLTTPSSSSRNITWNASFRGFALHPSFSSRYSCLMWHIKKFRLFKRKNHLRWTACKHLHNGDSLVLHSSFLKRLHFSTVHKARNIGLFSCCTSIAACFLSRMMTIWKMVLIYCVILLLHGLDFLAIYSALKLAYCTENRVCFYEKMKQWNCLIVKTLISKFHPRDLQ